MARVTDVQVGDAWRFDDGTTWRVVGPAKAHGDDPEPIWPLSGPLPARGVSCGTTAEITQGALVSRIASP